MENGREGVVMAIIRVIEIENFRAIRSLRFLPGAGINCLIGPGDSGKSTILDAIDLCLGARRSLTFNDADFHGLDVGAPIRIALTIGALDDALKAMDVYGDFLVGFNAATGVIEAEPGAGLETALTLQLTVQSDLEPDWTLVSPRAVAAGRVRNLAWADRARIAPARLGAAGHSHLTWRRGSVLSRLTEGKANTSKELAKAAREMRDAFDQEELKELEAPLLIVREAAAAMGVPVGEAVQALIDAGSVSFTGGTISLHDGDGVPLRALGVGSSRLLVAALQRKVAETATTVLVDELEHGLEPHRIIRLLGALGAKEDTPPLQVFATSHSPVVVAELSAGQLYIVRGRDGAHVAMRAGDAGNVQGTIRMHAHALLASSVIVCEGASEIGLVRGLDQYFTENGETPLATSGATLLNGNGDETFSRALNMQTLRYRTAILRDTATSLRRLPMKRGSLPRVELCSPGVAGRLLSGPCSPRSPPKAAALLQYVVELKERPLIEAHIATYSANTVTLAMLEVEVGAGLGQASRALLGGAAAWFDWIKTITAMEGAGRTIVGPGFAEADAALTDVIDRLFDWAEHDR